MDREVLVKEVVMMTTVLYISMLDFQEGISSAERQERSRSHQGDSMRTGTRGGNGTKV